MPARYVICTVEVAPDGLRYPVVQLIADPSKPLEVDPETGQVYSIYSSSCVVSDGIGTPGQADGEALCLVGGGNMSNLNSDARVEKLIEVPDSLLPELKNALEMSPNEAFNPGQRNKFVKMFTDRGIDTSGVTLDDPFWKWGELMSVYVTGDIHDIRLLTIPVPE